MSVASARRLRPRLVLVLVGSASLMTVLDSTAVIAALPSIRDDLGFTPSGATWVLVAHGVAVGGCLLSAGRLADALGPRRVFVVALAAFGLASLLCGFAWAPWTLVATRVLQGVAAAALTPAALALLLAAHPDGPARSRALAVWSGLGSVGATAGLLLGGALAATIGWSWLFWANVPVCVIVLALTRRELPSPPREPGRSPDLPSALALAVTLSAVVLALLSGPEAGWSSLRTLGALVVAAIAATTLVVLQRRAVDGILPASLLKLGGVRAGNLVVLLVGVAVDGLLLLATWQAQDVLGLGALQFGLLAAAMTLTCAVAVAVGQALLATAGARTVTAVGGALIVVAGLVLALGGTGEDWRVLGLGLAVFGVGMGLVFIAGQIVSLTGVPVADAGTASGLEETSFSIGTTLGPALVAAVAGALVVGGVSLSSSIATTFLVVAGVGGTLLLAALVLLPRVHPRSAP